MAKRNNSASNVAERTPVSTGTVSAPAMAGAAGFGLAHVIFKECEEIGMLAERQANFRKPRLLELIKLGKEDRNEFRAQMLAKQAELNEDAKAVPNRTLRDYLDDFPKANSLYVEASRWIGMSKSVDIGWTPKNDAGETLELNPEAWPAWRLLEMQATKARESAGKASTDPANPQGVPSKKRGRPQATQKTPVQKAVAAVTNALKDPATGNAMPKNNRNIAEVIRGILSDATVKELNEVLAVVQKQMEIATKAEAEAAKMAAKAKKAAEESSKNKDKELADNQQRTSAGAVVTRTDASGQPKGKTQPQPEREGTVPQS